MQDTAAPKGIDVGPVSDWLLAHVPGTRAPFTFQLVAGGRSNLTSIVTDAGGRRVVLRRPPLGQVLASAHDMGREQGIIAALAASDVPVPTSFGLCDDLDVNGAPFYVMDFVDGHVLRDAASTEALLDEAGRRRTSESIVEVMARIHAVDVDAVGLGQLGKREGYVERQLRRWHGQFERSNADTGRPVPLVHEVHERLSKAVPEQVGTAIVHGDYRLDNCMVDDDGEVVAVLDWELCTLGDPMADLGLLLVYWTEAGDTVAALPGSPTALPGFLTRDEMVARYAEVSGRDVGDVAFYVALGYWKLACILEGVYARYAGGSMGDDGADHSYFADAVVSLTERAAAVAADL